MSSSLVKFGRRQSARLQSLSSRQVVALALTAVVSAGVAVSAAAGQVALAVSLLAVLLVATLAAVVFLVRRVRLLHSAEQASVRDLRLVVEQLQRRVVAAVEKERLAAGDRHQELRDAITGADRLTPRAAEALLRAQSGEIEALVQLFQELTPRAPMPPGGVALHPSDLLGLLHLVRSRSPQLVVALGGTASAVWLAYALEKTGGRLVVVDHDAANAERTRALLTAHDLNTVEVLHAPLTELTVDNGPVDWYDVDALDALHDIDLLLVEGPAPLGPAEALPPALHVLGRRLAEGAAVVAEDAPRVAPRQLAPQLVPQRPLAGRYTAWAYGPLATASS